MFLLGERLVVSASDLRLAASCEFAVVRGLDVLRGRAAAAQVPEDPMLDRVARLGDAHEQAELRRLLELHPGGVVQFPRPDYTREALTTAMDATLAATSGGADVVVQATVFDGRFVGHADFLERTADGWLVSDTKLARSESVTALLQVAAYASVLAEAGVDVAPVARLVLGDGEAVDRPLGDLVAAYRARRDRLEQLLADHDAESSPAVWGDDRWLACGRCPVCEPEVEAARDLLLVAGMRGPTRARLLDAGVRTLEELAAHEGPVRDVRTSTLERLRAQARLQLAQDRDPDHAVSWELVDADALRLMPPPSAGDLFFDFEGDPLWHERGSGDWGLEYLFGMVEVESGRPAFRAFWAHDRAQERAALVRFVDHVRERRRQWPGLHIYHYAPYETAALTRLAARHGVCENEVDDLLRAGVFVDLYAVVRASLRVSQRSYSIKKLEPLYMEAREEDVQGGAESIVAYHEYEQAVVEGREEQARSRLADIADYNEKDCESTLLLRDWLWQRRREVWGEEPAPAEPVTDDEPVLSDKRAAATALEGSVRALVEAVPVADRTPEQQAVALVGAAVLYHAREDKPGWQEHFERLRVPVSEWRSADGVFVVDRVEVLQDWSLPPRARKPRRRLLLHGEPAQDAPLPVGAKVSAVYAVPAPDGVEAEPLHAHAKSPSGISVLATEDRVSDGGWVRQVLEVEELQPGPEGHEVGPVALVPNDHVRTDGLDAALAEVAEQVLAGGATPRTAGCDLLARRAPRLRSGDPLPDADGPGGAVEAITEALTGLDRSFLAVQGPPGTGKTYVGARVVAALVDRGWAVGVCAQSHAAVENVLTAVVQAGVDPAQVGKAAKSTREPTWTALPSADGLAAFAAGHASAGRGYVVGGSAWDLTNTARVGRDQLDLLVVDEAGQFSLARTLAVSVAARRLLLLGDPQQLPGVTTGTHAEPVDVAALVWLAQGRSVLPEEFGYFLSTTWRMHPALTQVVSDLAYDGRLHSTEAVTAARVLEGVDPGLHLRLVHHRDNSTHSVEEAREVLRIAEDLLGRTWHDPSATDEDGAAVGPRPLEQRDLLVITPYNHQVRTIQRVLQDAGLDDLAARVGTVDRFQGQEAAVAIVSMAASSHTDVPRGMGFLLDRHRLNVAISRGQYAAFLVHSAVLTDMAPRTPEELVALGAFLRLGAAATTSLAPSPAAG